jgi:regulator of protease activity HflC (stomatin/prohibitin superfamily)
MMPVNNKKPVPPGYGGLTGGNFVSDKFKIRAGVAGLSFVILLIAAFQFIGFVEVKGHQAAVVEVFYDVPLLGLTRGVQEDVLGPGRHFYIPLLQKPYTYNVGTDNFIMGKPKYYTGKGTDYVDFPALEIKCGGRGQEQPATFSVTLQYQLDTNSLTKMHKRAQKHYKDRIIKPALTNIIKNLTVEQHVLEFYTGHGYNDLQKQIEHSIANNKVLSELGIVVNTFVIDQIDLDPKYEEEIRERQLATQRKLKENELKKAADAEAIRKEAEANANKLVRIKAAEAAKEERIKAAEADKREKVLAAEAKKQQVELNAEADAKKVRLAASADRYRKEQDSKGALALGIAQAKVLERKKNSKYEGEAGARAAAVDIERAKENRLRNMNITGVVTENTIMSVMDGKNLNNPPTVTIESTKLLGK